MIKMFVFPSTGRILSEDFIVEVSEREYWRDNCFSTEGKLSTKSFQHQHISYDRWRQGKVNYVASLRACNLH